MQGLVDFAVQRFGALDASCSTTRASPVPRRELLLDDDLADFRRVIDVNLLGVMARHAACSAAHDQARRRVDHQHGVDRALLPGAGFTTYRAAKAAVVHSRARPRSTWPHTRSASTASHPATSRPA